MWHRLRPLARAAAATTGLGALALGVQHHGVLAEPYKGPKASRLREHEHALSSHYHGKWRVKVLKVRRPPPGVEAPHDIAEFKVAVRLYSDEYEKVFTEDDNADLIATDTQKNTVYVVAKRTECRSPEQYGIDLATHFLKEYPILTSVEVDVAEAPWHRATVSGEAHDHAFVLGSNETAFAEVAMHRAKDGSIGKPTVTSSIQGMTILKTTQSGFAGYLRDKYTLLPECAERCLATELAANWTYMPSDPPPDYVAVRKVVREQLKRGIFGPAKGGIFSASLQATIYDAGCLVLDAAPAVASLSLFTPNLHYLPAKLLDSLGEQFADDVFIPTFEPSGTISCTVSRGGKK